MNYQNNIGYIKTKHPNKISSSYSSTNIIKERDVPYVYHTNTLPSIRNAG